MNRDPEDIQRHLLKLVQDLLPIASLPDIEIVSTSGFMGSSCSPQGEPTVELGDVPAVQDRFHALLKHRLRDEIQQNPPLFPWETEFCDYESNTAYGAVEASLGDALLSTSPQYNNSPTWVWIRQLNALQLPVPVPRNVLAQLLERCQAVAQSSLKEGSKLVQAVEDLFPQQSEALNYLAGLVIPAPARSPNPTLPSVTQTDLPSNYETAAVPQQMVLSLLAAREILSSLTLTLRGDQPATERQWETDFGKIVVHAAYEVGPDTTSIRAQVTLPCGGSVNLRTLDSQVRAERSTAGLARVELFSPEIDQIYPLEVRLADQDQTPLIFSIRIAGT